MKLIEIREEEKVLSEYLDKGAYIVTPFTILSTH